MKGMSIFVLALLFSLVAVAQEVQEGSIGKLRESFEIVIENGANESFHNGDKTTFKVGSRCQAQKGAEIRVGGLSSDKRVNIHYRVDNRKQTGQMCPDRVMFKLTPEELAKLHVRWNKGQDWFRGY